LLKEKGFQEINLETLIFVAPPIGESYNFSAMIAYSILFKSKE
jgi:hypothetical protein